MFQKPRETLYQNTSILRLPAQGTRPLGYLLFTRYEVGIARNDTRPDHFRDFNELHNQVMAC